MLERFGDEAKACFRDILEHRKTHGDCGWAEVRNRHPKINKPLFAALFDEAMRAFSSGRSYEDVVAADEPQEQPPPAEPLVTPRARSRARDISELRQKLIAAERLQEEALGAAGADGERPIIDPAKFAKAIDDQRKLVLAIILD